VVDVLLAGRLYYTLHATASGGAVSPPNVGRVIPCRARRLEGGEMAESVYKIIELVGTSEDSWEEAVATAIETASKSLRDLRIAEVSKLDVQIENGKVVAYRARISVSFKYERED
jgi:flavin-binding protein dodecin